LPESVISEHLFDDDQLVCASAKHRLASKQQLTIADLEPEQWALSEPGLESSVWLQGRFRDGGFPPPRIALESRSVALRLRTVASSKLLTFASRGVFELARSSRLPLVLLDVRELTRSRQIGAIFRKEAYLPPVVRRFIEILKSEAENQVEPGRLR
jgi:DNA-binding transcriptional LysR family regulator